MRKEMIIKTALMNRNRQHKKRQTKAEKKR